jgi:hypothetical protein
VDGKKYSDFLWLHLRVRLFLFSGVRMKGRGVMKEKSLKNRITHGQLRREDVARRLAELAFGRSNDCVKLAMGDTQELGKLDLGMLTEFKRSEKGAVEVKLVDRLKALELLAAMVENDGGDLEGFLRSLQEEGP